MPTYEFRCPSGHEFTHFYKTMSTALVELPCPECSALAKRQLSAGAGLVFKGSGFYLTDYGKNAHRAQDGGQRTGDGGEKGDSKPTSDSTSKTDSATAKTESTAKSDSKGDNPSSASKGESSKGESSKGESSKGESSKGESSKGENAKPKTETAKPKSE